MRVPIETLHLFPVLNEKLISFLRDLPPGDWLRQTVAREWVVKDVAAHMIDVNYRRIALHRDGWSVPSSPITSNEDLVRYLNRLNGDWVKAAKRISPAMLIEWLEWSNETVYALFKKLDPFSPSPYPVSWAGQASSLNWFDTAREYTERWLHQQQIREAVGDHGLLTDELYGPFLEIFMEAWPYTLQDTVAADGTLLKTIITGPGGGEWWLQRRRDSWEMIRKTGMKEVREPVAAETSIEGAIAWTLFSKSWRKEDIIGRFSVKGDPDLGEKILQMVSVMA